MPPTWCAALAKQLGACQSQHKNPSTERNGFAIVAYIGVAVDFKALKAGEART
jgi:hypothetical protein